MLGNRQHHIRLALGLFAIALFASILIGCKESRNELPVGVFTANGDYSPKQAVVGSGSYLIYGTVLASGTLAPAEAVTVSLLSDGILIDKTRTSSDGTYFFDNLGQGTYDLRFAEDSTIFKSKTIYLSLFETSGVSPVLNYNVLLEKR